MLTNVQVSHIDCNSYINDRDQWFPCVIVHNILQYWKYVVDISWSVPLSRFNVYEIISRWIKVIYLIDGCVFCRIHHKSVQGRRAHSNCIIRQMMVVTWCALWLSTHKIQIMHKGLISLKEPRISHLNYHRCNLLPRNVYVPTPLLSMVQKCQLLRSKKIQPNGKILSWGILNRTIRETPKL